MTVCQRLPTSTLKRAKYIQEFSPINALRYIETGEFCN